MLFTIIMRRIVLAAHKLCFSGVIKLSQIFHRASIVDVNKGNYPTETQIKINEIY